MAFSFVTQAEQDQAAKNALATKQGTNPLVSNVISSTNMSPTAPVKIAPTNSDTTNYSGITTGITDSIINDYNSLNKQLTDKQTSQEGAATDILKLMGDLTNKTADTQAANEAAGVNTETANLNKYAQQLADLNAQASSLNREAQAIPLQTQENNRNTGATDAGIAPQNAGALRLNALKALSIGQQADIAAAAATGSQLRLQAAKDKAQQIIDLKYKPLEDALAIKEKQYELNKDVLMSIDKKRTEALGLAIDKEKTALADKKEKDNQIADIKIELAKKGVNDATILGKIDKATSVSEAINVAFPYLKTPNTDIVKLDNGSTIMVDKNTGAIIKTYGGAKPSDITPLNFVNNYNAYKNNAIASGQIPVDMETYNAKVKDKTAAIQLILGSAKFTKDQKQDLIRAINDGQDAFSVIKNQAKNIAGQTEGTKITNFEVAKEQLTSIGNLLKDYYAQGGKTDIFRGNFEKTINKLGQVDNPKLVELSTQIASALQIYRNAVSGTAYSVQEGKDIASIFPGINKTEGLNNAILEGRMKAFDSTIDGSYRSVLGNTYDNLKKAEETINKSSSQLLQEANTAKQQVNEFWQKSDGSTQQMLMALFNKGFNDIDVIEYLKAKKLIK